MNNKHVEFIGRVVRQTYSSEDYKMYAIDVDDNKYPNLKHTIYGNICIGGNIHSLILDNEYYIKAIEKSSSKGYKYEVTNIRKTDLKSEGDVYTFLQEILTFNQASELYREYPNIIDLIKNGKDNEIDLSKLHGIGPYIFKIIKEKIIENYALFDLVSEFKGVLTISMLKKLYDKYPSIEKIRSELHSHPYKTLCGLSRVGFKTADKLLLEMEKSGVIKFDYDLKTSKERCMACILYFLEDNEASEGNTKMNIVDLKKHVMRLTPACSNYFVECLNEGKEKNNIYFNKDTMDVSLMNTYLTEVAISLFLKQGIKYNNIWNIDWKSYKNKGEYTLSDEQLKSLQLICENNIVVLCGFAGSGKTATTNTLIKMLKDNNKSFSLCASTGRASKVLSSYTGEDASTIHRLYRYQPPNTWLFNHDNPIDTDIIIVDESSMCDIFLFFHLLDGIDFKRTKLFIIGDPAQLCSVGPGNVLNDLIFSNKIPVATLTKIFRYSDGGLMQAATDVRNGKIYLNKKTNKPIMLGLNKDYIFWQTDKKDTIKRVKDLYKNLLDQGYTTDDILVLTAQNKGDYGTVVLNNEIQKTINKNFGSDDYMKIGEIKYYVGDIVLQTVNNYKAKLADASDIDFFDEEEKITLIANGESGIIESVEFSNIIINFNGIRIKYTRDDMKNVSLGYVLTTHKSQGGSARIVILITCSSHTFMQSSNLLYVGLTRTKERCFHIGDLETVNRAIKKKEEKLRKTFLIDLLKKG